MQLAYMAFTTTRNQFNCISIEKNNDKKSSERRGALNLGERGPPEVGLLGLRARAYPGFPGFYFWKYKL